MALINCPQCGHMISDKAKACPKCGYILKSEQIKPVEKIDDEELEPHDDSPRRGSGLKWLFIVLAIFGVGGVGYYFYTDNKAQKEMALAAEQARLDSIEAARLDSIRQDSIARRNFTTPDLAFNELHGHVDICKSGCGAGSYYTTFSYNNMGELISIDNVRPKFTRDKNGQITKDGDGDDVTIYKWKDNKISTELRSGLQYESNEYGPVIIRYFYNSDNQLAYTTYDDSDRNWGEGQRRRKCKITYSNYQFDEMGNWISRKATSTYQYNFGDGWENCTEEWAEDRIITYHDSNIGKDEQ